jgi:hypothetical protein
MSAVRLAVGINGSVGVGVRVGCLIGLSISTGSELSEGRRLSVPLPLVTGGAVRLDVDCRLHRPAPTPLQSSSRLGLSARCGGRHLVWLSASMAEPMSV